MRTGYTTGSCATRRPRRQSTAIGHEAPKIVTVHLPIGKDAALTVFRCEVPARSYMLVIKDGGDDPDVTHGAVIRRRPVVPRSTPVCDC